MKTDLKTTYPEYIEALATQEYPPLDSIDIDKVTARVNKRNGFKAGYQLALSHTNHAELVEALNKIMEMCDGNDPSHCSFYYCAKEALTKSETSKL